MTSLKDIYWLAGLLEGEGCFAHSIYHTTGRASGKEITGVTFRIQLSMTDRDIVERAAKLFGREVTEVITQGTLSYRVQISGSDAIQWMMTLYPLMGIRRSGKILSIIKEWKEYKARGRTLITHCKNGHLLPANRTCLKCVYEARKIRKLNKLVA